MKYLIYPLILLSLIIVPGVCQNSAPDEKESMLYILATLATNELALANLATNELEKIESLAQKKQAPYVCLWQGCLKQFHQPDIFYTHVNNHSIKRKINQVCLWKNCIINPTNYTLLRQHLRTHTQEKPWVCDHCKKGFSRKHRLKSHIDNQVCQKRFEDIGWLKCPH